MSTTPSGNKYLIKSLEEDIGLFDRKLAHLLKYETFPSEEDRQAAADKLSAKRERLVRSIREMTEPAVDAPHPVLVPSRKAAAKRKASAKPSAAAKQKVAEPKSEPPIPA